jgi:hypothetical protein
MDVEKTIQFLREQQARFDARQAEYEVRQAEYEVRQAEYEVRQAEYEIRGAKYEKRHAAFVEGMIQINDVVLRLATAQERSNAIVTTLAERLVELEQNVDALVSAIERHIASHS